jgi:hypothetical protein
MNKRFMRDIAEISLRACKGSQERGVAEIALGLLDENEALNERIAKLQQDRTPAWRKRQLKYISAPKTKINIRKLIFKQENHDG